ncbi:acyltransferase [Leifsonia sp. NPDC080035]|uniref:Acyltransferase n=1 Tax=Leifsonia sp. NPDC080035 TaxID=3143936 RepID=A0AAU7GAC8_9MICO
MSTVAERPARIAPPAPARVRDGSVDLVRAACLGVVVVLHALMVGVSIGPHGLVLENALEGWAGFPALTWVAQVMPLFFVLGGFSAYGQWTRMREAGGGYGDYLAKRVRRLLLPASGALVATAVLLAGLTLTGLPASVVATAGFRLGQPLWFLGVYVLCTAAVPFLAEAHRRRPVAAIGALATLALTVDAVRAITGLTAIGFANLLFVWLLVQQLGFWLASGRFEGMRRPALLALAAAGVAVVVVGASCGLWSLDLYADLNPPATALAAFGVAQLAAFRLLRGRLRAAAERPAIASVVGAVNARAMTIYSWHMLALIALAGLLLLAGVALPVPLSGAWWATRPLWIVAAVAAVGGLVMVASRTERRPDAAGASVGPARAIAAAACGAGGVLTALIAGSSPSGWVIASVLVLAALRIARRSRDRAPSVARLGAPRPEKEQTWRPTPSSRKC